MNNHTNTSYLLICEVYGILCPFHMATRNRFIQMYTGFEIFSAHLKLCSWCKLPSKQEMRDPPQTLTVAFIYTVHSNTSIKCKPIIIVNGQFLRLSNLREQYKLSAKVVKCRDGTVRTETTKRCCIII